MNMRQAKATGNAPWNITKGELAIVANEELQERYSPGYYAYDALRTKAMLAKPGGAELILKIIRRRKRRACMLLFVGALFFMGAGVWQCIEPSVPSYGASAALLMDLANFTLGIYGPAMVFFALGITCLIASVKRIPGAFFQSSIQAKQ